MFTILPSLYLIGIRYYKQWKTPYYHEESKKQELLVTIVPPVENKKVKIPRKKSKPLHLRRKTSISALSHDDIICLKNKTGFNQEEIIIWYTDFLVCNLFEKKF